MKKQINDLLLKMQTGENCIGETANKLLDLYSVSNCTISECNGIKDPNIVKIYALITRKDGLTDVWFEGKCLGEGLDTDGMNKLNL